MQLQEDVHNPEAGVGVKLPVVERQVHHGQDVAQPHRFPGALAGSIRGPLLAVRLEVDDGHHRPAVRRGHRDGLVDQGVHVVDQGV